MKEILDIIQAYHQAHQLGKRTALATVVRLEGSSYRRPGARMLITEDGQLTGAISGGCLEGDALRRAMLSIQQQRNKLVTYDTTDDDDAQVGIQLGCNGIVHVLFEPIDPEASVNPIELLTRSIEKRRQSVLVTLFSLDRSALRQPGTCLLYVEGAVIESPVVGGLTSKLWRDCVVALENESSAIKTYNSDNEKLFGLVEFIVPPVSLIIAGAGNDAKPLVEMASTMGWKITIVDGRPNYATVQRFPKANRIIVSKPENVVAQLALDKETAVLLMTHNYNYDLAVLRDVLTARSECMYIGSLGPQKKLERICKDLRDQGLMIGQDKLGKLYGPIGLDIGSETAEEIALSILAEVKAVLSGKSARPLRERREPIHGTTSYREHT